MKKVVFLVLISFLSINIFSLAFKVEEKDMTWRRMGVDPFCGSFKEAIMAFKKDPLDVREFCVQQWNKGDEYRKYRVFQQGDFLQGTVYSGKLPGTVPIVKYGKITIGFDKAYSKYVECYKYGQQVADSIEKLNIAEDGSLKDVQYYAYFYFGDNYAGRYQCNNAGRDFENIKVYLQSKPSKPKVVTKIDTVYIDRCRPKVSWSGWISHAQDHFAESTPDSINYGDYYVTDLKDKHDDQLIWSLLGNITGKVHLGSWALVGFFEAGYNNGPVDWQARFLGIEKNWNDRFFLQFGPEYRYREWTKWEKIITNYIDPNNFEFQMQGHRAAIFDLGAYLQMEWFNLTGDNHARLYYGQGFRQPGTRIETGTSEVKFSFKLELEKWYLFFGTKYQFMPTTVVDSINVPMIDHLSLEPRIGYSIHPNWILFARYRNIRNRTFEDFWNPDWSLYERQDFGGGFFFRPQKMLGIKNLYAELILSDSHIKETFENHYQNTEDELMEVKLTFFYHWTQ